MISQERKAAAFEALHKARPFVIPNPWDAGSARVLAALGYEALATTSLQQFRGLPLQGFARHLVSQQEVRRRPLDPVEMLV